MEIEKTPTYGIALEGTGAGVVRVENSAFTPQFTSVDIADANDKRLELVANKFDAGLEYFSYQSQMAETVDPGSLSSEVRLAEVANFVQPAIGCQMNLATPGESGLDLLTSSSDYTLETKNHSCRGWFKSVSGYMPYGSPKELLFEASHTLFEAGNEPGNAQINFYYYDWNEGQIDVDYKLPGGSWTNAGTVTLDGGGAGYEMTWDGADNPYFYYASIPVTGAVFEVGTQIRLSVTGDAFFSYFKRWRQ